MLEIKIDLVPFGREAGRRTIGTVRIANDGTGDGVMGNYKYTLADEAAEITGELKKFKRIKGNAFHLLRDVLIKALL